MGTLEKSQQWLRKGGDRGDGDTREIPAVAKEGRG